MSSTSLQLLKTRISGIEVTRKITKAMQMTAAARMKGIKNKAEETMAFVEDLKHLVEITHKSLSVDGTGFEDLNYHQLLQAEHKAENTQEFSKLILLFTSDRGLCGGFNNAILKLVASKYKEASENIGFICIGRRGYETINKLEGTVLHYTNAPTSLHGLSFEKLQQTLLDPILEVIRQVRFVSCQLIYSHFISVTKQEARAVQLFPIKIDHYPFITLPRNDYEPLSIQSRPNDESEFEPKLKLILPKIIRQYCATSIFHALLNSRLSEESARMIAMDSATSNSEDMLDRLKIQYNSSRQDSITKELIEIISGSNSINDQQS